MAQNRLVVGLVLIAVFFLIHGCRTGKEIRTVDRPCEMTETKTLKIRWERLVSDGQTCPRCGSTEQQLETAVFTLSQSFTPLGVEVLLEKSEISVEEFKKDPLRSNQIWLNDRSLEDWIGGEIDQSACCDVCGPSECRIIVVGEEAYETIPAGLIVKAGLVAASQLVCTETGNSSCCGGTSTKGSSSGCCPGSHDRSK